jgi:hypothetical protein
MNQQLTAFGVELGYPGLRLLLLGALWHSRRRDAKVGELFFDSCRQKSAKFGLTVEKVRFLTT